MQALDKVLKIWPKRATGYVYIKSGEDANYKQLVDVLDEMNSTGQRHYNVQAMSAADRQLLAHQRP